MIDSLHIENFRCFQKLDLRELGKFNIIVGDNGSGKTAFLEAIFLPGNGAAVPIQYRTMRGMIAPNFSPENQAYEALFSDLFFGFSADSNIEISLNGSYDNLRKARIFFKPITERSLFPEAESKGAKITTKLFTVHTTDADKKESIQIVNLRGTIDVGGEHKIANIAFITSASVPNPAEMAQMFSDLNKNDAAEPLRETISKLFTGISDLSVELTGGVGEIYCSVGGLTKKVPISLASNGLNKILAILLFIATHSKGVALIDEIENGIHYKRIPQVWEAIIKSCQKYDVQLFASTHSEECLNALKPFLEKEKNDFRLIRTEGENGAGHTARIFKGENFYAALETGTEIR